jgi:hypothetical protein
MGTDDSASDQSSAALRSLVVVAAVAVQAVASSTSSGPPTVPAAYTASGSVQQLYVVDAAPGTALSLVDATGHTLQTGTADDQGSFIFRNVAAGAGYTVRSPAGADTAASEPVDVTDPDQVPDQSFYSSQTVGAGYQ